jgi:hypothetical protein
MSSRLRAAAMVTLVAVIAASGCSSSLFGKKYEYEEDVTLALDGSATIVINASIAALVALRGLDLDVDRSVRVDRDKIRAAYESPVTRVVVRPPWTRAGRRFVQIRVETDDIRKLPSAAPFAWSTYELAAKDARHVFRQTVGASAFRPGTLANVGWKGDEIVAFRIHLPSVITFHNSRTLETDQPAAIQRGNILAWEQPLRDRLTGAPLHMEARMGTQSILYRTLWLFGGTFAAAMAVLALIIWRVSRKGRSVVPA